MIVNEVHMAIGHFFSLSSTTSRSPGSSEHNILATAASATPEGFTSIHFHSRGGRLLAGAGISSTALEVPFLVD